MSDRGRPRGHRERLGDGSLTPQGAAKRSGLSINVIYKLLKDKRLEAERRGEWLISITEGEIDRLSSVYEPRQRKVKVRPTVAAEPEEFEGFPKVPLPASFPSLCRFYGVTEEQAIHDLDGKTGSGPFEVSIPKLMATLYAKKEESK